MRINLRRRHILVPEEILHRADEGKKNVQHSTLNVQLFNEEPAVVPTWTLKVERSTLNVPASIPQRFSLAAAVCRLLAKIRTNSSVSSTKGWTSAAFSKGTRWISRSHRRDSRSSLWQIFNL